MSDISPRPLSLDEARELVGWAGRESWNPGIGDADAFYSTDPGGFIGTFADGRLVAGISAIRYGSDFGFVGLYICRPEFRGRGHGLIVWKAGMERLSGRTVGLDGVTEQQDNYARMGFRIAYRTTRWTGRVEADGGPAEGVEPVSPDMATEIAAFDRRFFCADRSNFVSQWIAPPRHAFVVREEGRLRGYAVIRECREGRKLGPLFAENEQMVRRLINACAEVADGAEIHLDVPFYQQGFIRHLQALGFVQGFETARMYVGPAPAIEQQGVFAVTTLELG